MMANPGKEKIESSTPVLILRQFPEEKLFFVRP